MNELVTIDFHGSDIIAVEKDGEILVPMKRICENLSLDWSAQKQRIERDSVLSIAMGITPIPTEGGTQQLLTLPLKYLNGFLFGISDSRIQDPEIKAKIIMYKQECYDVLYNHFHPKQDKFPIISSDIANTIINSLKPIIVDHLNISTNLISRHNAQINALYDGFLKLANQHDSLVDHQDQIIEEIKEAFQIVKSENLAAINSLKNSIIKANANSATPNGRMVTLAELKRDPALGPIAARFINNRSNQSLAQSLSFWTEHNGQKLGRSGSVNLYPYDLAITFFDESTNPYIKKYI